MTTKVTFIDWCQRQARNYGVLSPWLFKASSAQKAYKHVKMNHTAMILSAVTRGPLGCRTFQNLKEMAMDESANAAAFSVI